MAERSDLYVIVHDAVIHLSRIYRAVIAYPASGQDTARTDIAVFTDLDIFSYLGIGMKNGILSYLCKRRDKHTVKSQKTDAVFHMHHKRSYIDRRDKIIPVGNIFYVFYLNITDDTRPVQVVKTFKTNTGIGGKTDTVQKIIYFVCFKHQYNLLDNNSAHMRTFHILHQSSLFFKYKESKSIFKKLIICKYSFKRLIFTQCVL